MEKELLFLKQLDCHMDQCCHRRLPKSNRHTRTTATDDAILKEEVEQIQVREYDEKLKSSA